MAARPDTGVDLLLGVGGTPEGIIAACAMKCIGGVIQGRLWPQDDEERQRALDAGHDLDPDFVLAPTTWSPATTASSSPPASPTASCCAASATAPSGVTTHSLVMRSRSGTIRTITTEHQLSKLRSLSAIDFDH